MGRLPKLGPEYAVTLDTFGIFINGELQIISDATILPSTTTILFVVTPDLANKMLIARSIGAAFKAPYKLQDANSYFFLGFQINTAKGHDKLSRMIASCHA